MPLAFTVYNTLFSSSIANTLPIPSGTVVFHIIPPAFKAKITLLLPKQYTTLLSPTTGRPLVPAFEILTILSPDLIFAPIIPSIVFTQTLPSLSKTGAERVPGLP